jgi:hypothetical protein
MGLATYMTGFVAKCRSALRHRQVIKVTQVKLYRAAALARVCGSIATFGAQVTDAFAHKPPALLEDILRRIPGVVRIILGRVGERVARVERSGKR